MATLEKIRSKAGLLVLVVGVALFAFIIGDFLNSGSTYFRQSQETVAEVDGEVIKIQEFQDRVDEMTEMYKMQTGSTSLPEEYQTQIRQSVFDGMVQDIVLNEATSELGMGVGPEELFDMVQGENISPMIQQMQMFVNPQTGAFDKTALLNFLKTIDDDNIANYPADQAAEKGGELGWFTEATALRGVNDDFKKAVFSTPVNDYSIVKSLYGTHIIKVTDKTTNVDKYKVADIDMTVSPSTKTYGNIYNELNQFISKNQNIDKLDDAAKEAGYNLLSNVTVTANDQLLGSIKNSRPVIRWAFQNNKGDISEIFECDDKFVIAAIQGTLPEGYRSLESVTPMLKSELIAQKKGEKIAQDLSAKNLSSVDAYAQAMNSSADSVKFVSFATRRIAGIGVEPKLNAMVSLAQKDQLSAPVVGNNGVYVFKVYEQNKDAKNYDEAAEIKALDASNAYRFGFQAIQSLVNKADVEDNRIRFY